MPVLITDLDDELKLLFQCIEEIQLAYIYNDRNKQVDSNAKASV